MLHRSALVAVAALVAFSTAGAAYSQAPGRAVDRAAVAAQAQTTQIQRIGPGRTIHLPVGPTVVYATTSLTCNNTNGSTTTYTLSVNGGNCVNATVTDADGVTRPLGQASCSAGNGDSTSASCGRGCHGSSGNGSCTSSTTPQ
jgi:hypothetical protein